MDNRYRWRRPGWSELPRRREAPAPWAARDAPCDQREGLRLHFAAPLAPPACTLLGPAGARLFAATRDSHFVPAPVRPTLHTFARIERELGRAPVRSEQ